MYRLTRITMTLSKSLVIAAMTVGLLAMAVSAQTPPAGTSQSGNLPDTPPPPPDYAPPPPPPDTTGPAVA
ncbi:MAG: hypothetical protein AB9866_11730 [Syntrophobacteraceae bacterium]